MVICKKDEFFHVIRLKKESKCKNGCARIPAHPRYVLLCFLVIVLLRAGRYIPQ